MTVKITIKNSIIVFMSKLNNKLCNIFLLLNLYFSEDPVVLELWQRNKEPLPILKREINIGKYNTLL